MRFARPIALLLTAGPALGIVACAPKPIQTRTTSAPASRGRDQRDLIVLLPDPDSGTVGRATVSNAFGTVDLAGARAATVVGRNEAPAPATTLGDAELQQAIGSAFDALPPAPQHFIVNFRFDSEELTAESRAVLPKILQTVKGRPAPEVLVVGHTDTTGPSATVYPAAEFPHEVLRHGGAVVEVNPEPSELTPDATLSLRGPGAAVLTRLLDHIATEQAART